MTLKNALNHFDSLLAETDKKSERKIYEEYIRILTGLQQRDLSTADIQAIEAKLEALGLSSTSSLNDNHLKKALKQFKKYLKDSFSLTTKGYYTTLGVGLGTLFGALFGVVLLSSFERSLGIALGISFGMLIGVVVGRYMDAQAEASGMTV